MRALLVLVGACLSAAFGATLPVEARGGAAPCWTVPAGPLPGAARQVEVVAAMAGKPREEGREEARTGSHEGDAPLLKGTRGGATPPPAIRPPAVPRPFGDRPPALSYLRVNGSADAHGARA